MALPHDAPLPHPGNGLANVISVRVANFSYIAQTDGGVRLSGILEAVDGGDAAQILENLRLRVIELKPAARNQAQPTAITADGFLAFHQQVARLASAGVPLGKALGLAAADLRGGRMASAVAAIAADLRRGTPLDEAFKTHRQFFPPLYGKLIDAGMTYGTLPVVLLNLGKHFDVQRRLSALLWRSLASPLMTLCGVMLVLSLIGWVVTPHFESTFSGMRLRLPWITELVLSLGTAAPYLMAAAVALAIMFAVAWGAAKIFGGGRAAAALAPRIPIAGPVIRYRLIARWIGAVRIGLIAGLDLATAIQLAGESAGSTALAADGAALAAAQQSGRPTAAGKTALLPGTVALAIESTSDPKQVPDALLTLSDLYEWLAELRLQRIASVLTPLLTMLIAILIGTVILGLLLPLVEIIRIISSVKI